LNYGIGADPVGAAAAAMPLKGPRLPAPLYTWTGFYIGGNLGYGWGAAATDIVGAGSATANSCAVGCGPGTPAGMAIADRNTARLSGLIGGGQLGYNRQFSRNGLLGFEADIQRSGHRGSNTFADPFSRLWQSTSILRSSVPQQFVRLMLPSPVYRSSGSTRSWSIPTHYLVPARATRHTCHTPCNTRDLCQPYLH
jgi:hypothetical protein